MNKILMVIQLNFRENYNKKDFDKIINFLKDNNIELEDKVTIYDYLNNRITAHILNTDVNTLVGILDSSLLPEEVYKRRCKDGSFFYDIENLFAGPREINNIHFSELIPIKDLEIIKKDFINKAHKY